jgi:glycosyltransferase involved in cell wall biosynthesis
MNPLLSIIVPIYNVERYLPACMNSILAQSYADFELILVNDGSPDRCGVICDAYAAKDSRIRVIHKENGGVSSARNAGIEAAKGEYIGFIDPDDEIEPGMYETLLENVLKHGADIAVCPIRTFNLISNDESISTVWEQVHCRVDKNTIETSIIPAILSNNFCSLLSSVNKLYKKHWIDHFHIRFDVTKHHGEDVRFNLKLLMQINTLVFVEQPLYNYFIRNGNSLTQTFREDLYDYILDNKTFGLFLCHKYNAAQCVEGLINRYTLTTIGYMETVVGSDMSISKKYEMISKIMKDPEFAIDIVQCQCPTPFYKLLKYACIQKRAALFIEIVKMKYKLKHYIHKVRTK